MSSLSAPETSLSFSNPFSACESPSRLSLSSSSSTPSLYVTFKVLQLIKNFRKRVKTRVRFTKKETPRKARDDFCQEFERQAFEEIDRYLGRKTVYPQQKQRKHSTLTTPATKEVRSIEWLLDEVNQAAKSEKHSLTTLASNNKRFLQRKDDFCISKKYLSIQGLIQLLVLVKELLETLQKPTSSRCGAKTLCEGNELLDLELDETCLANLEHLLLCLKDQLLRLLTAKLVEFVYKHVIACQRDQSKHVDDWFFEFPDARHPLSTTWPWSIRPSLAVLWGVCWMFYDYDRSHPPRQVLFDQNGNMVNERGEIIAESRAVEQYLSNLQRQQQDYYQAANPEPRLHGPRSPHAFSHSRSSEEILGMAPAPQFPRSGLNSSAGTTHTSHLPQSVVSTVAHGSSGLAIQGTNNTYTAAPPAYDAQSPHGAANNWLPEEDFAATGFDFQANVFPADVSPWHLPQQTVPDQQQTAFVYTPDLPPRTRNPLTPTIRVTTSFPNIAQFPQGPQDPHHSANSVSSTASLPHQASFYPAQYPTHLSPSDPRFMPSEQQEMQTPPRSPQNGIIGEQISRKRSHSVMSGGAPPQAGSGGSRSNSVVSNQEHSMEEGYSPRNRTIHRGDPPINADNKYVCNFSSDCHALTFDRKCEWSKHMDKHDRPYKCPHPGCAKLQGFTYSGGLLRHEREVHSKHGGPKAQLMCPYSDCKRHSGKGFTRKENLNEHVRRVHLSKEQQSQPTPLKRDATDAFASADDVETPASEGVVDRDEHISPALKRRRYNPGISERSVSEDGGDDLKIEVRHLRDENARKDALLMEMEIKLDEERRDRQEETRRLQESIRQLQQQVQGQS